ncbi:hypothetical protein LAZ67_23001880 [Cordylochernes scorpioides]|uniref:Reverse transcriptase domain-containing protein n=1 Tax=Cordylochernes scorpioides TaxID=51811 RepID=A0ABY6LTH2_9ARAC|nr:hypothetical protein LAZ67_23001880 [Cordylochernes scorpioides]
MSDANLEFLPYYRRQLIKKSLQLARWKCHLVFNQKCSQSSFIPPSLRIHDPVGNHYSTGIIQRTEEQLLLSRIKGSRAMIRFLQRTIRGLLYLLSCMISPNDLGSLILTINSRVTIQNSEIESRHHKKFEFGRLKYGFPSCTQPKPEDGIVNLTDITLSDTQISLLKKRPQLPSTKKDFASLKTLKNHCDIIISRSDKGSQVVMMKAEEYERKMLDLLSDPDTFHEIPTERITALSDGFKFALRTLKRNGGITPEQFQRFTSNLTGVPYIYGLPKTHKPHIPLRPIVAYHLSPALHLAKYLTNLLKPLVKAHNLFSVQDSTEFLTKLKSVPQPDKLIMSTFDVTSLFLCLPHSLITDGLSSLLAFSTFSSKDQKSIIDLFTICLGMNTLEFNSRSFLQIRGSPMGSPLSTIAAEIVMLGLDQWLVSKDHLGVVTWLRYVDDIFCLHRDTDHLPILTTLNSYHPDLLFTHNPSRSNCIPFLDILIINTDDKFHTTVFHKPGFTPSYLHFSSHAPVSHKITTVRTLSKRIYTHSGIEQNPGPKMSKQTTLETSLDRDKDIKDLINALTKRLDSWGERLESRLSAIDDRVENINQRLQQLEESSAVTKVALSQNSKKIKDFEDQLEYLDAKSRERNLIFYGIEQDNNEDCRERIRKVIEENMQTKEKINITRCHRLSRKPGAPILIEVPEQNDRSTLFKAAFNLRGTKISLSKDYSMKTREQRRVLNVKRKELVERGTLAKLRDNKLIINDIAYKQADRKQSLVNSQPNDTFSLTCWNVNGLYRLNSVFPLLYSHLERYEIFALTETWCDHHLKNVPRGFHLFESLATRSSKLGRCSGGIIVGIKNKLKTMLEKVVVEHNWISIPFKRCFNIQICYIFTYISPNESQLSNFITLSKHVEDRLANGYEIVLAGDINIRTGTYGYLHNPLERPLLLSPERKSRDPVLSKHWEQLINFLDNNLLTIINGRTVSDKTGNCTFISSRGSSVVDYFIVLYSLLEHVVDLKVDNNPYSDHLPLTINMSNLSNLKRTKETVYPCFERYRWAPDNTSLFSQNLDNNQVSTDQNLDSLVNTFSKQILNAMLAADMRIKVRPGRPKSKPWYSRECYLAKKSAKASLTTFKETNTDVDRNIYVSNRKRYTTLINFNKKKYLQEKQELLKNARSDLSTLSRIDPELYCEISITEITREISSLANEKACGADEIPNEALKTLPFEHLVTLKNIFNRIINSGSYPLIWSKSIIHPIFKSGDRDNPSNYRGIALISNLSKLFTSILKSRLRNWIEGRSIIPENQAGFRKGYSCQDHIFTLLSLIQLTLRRKRRKLYAFFVDLKKAFDTVPHSLLWSKLGELGLDFRFVNLIRNYFEQMTTTVRWNGLFTEPIKIRSGVLQGEPLSPYLFILFVTDLINIFNDSTLPGIYLPNFGTVHLLMYADDIILIGESKINLQIKINMLKKYFETNHLTLNESKSKIMVFRNGGRPAKSDKWFWGDQLLTVTSKYLYLGYPLTTTISFSQVASYFKGKALAATGEVWKIMEKSRLNSFGSSMKLLDSIILSTLLYSAPIWANEKYKILDQIQNNYLRRLLNLPSNTPSYILRMETGRFSLGVTATKLILKFCPIMGNVHSDEYLYRFYRKFNEYPKLNWIHVVKELFRPQYSTESNTSNYQNHYRTVYPNRSIKNNQFEATHTLQIFT